MNYFTIPQMNWDEGNRLSIGSAIAHGKKLYVDAWDHHTFLDILFFSKLFQFFSPQTVVIIIRTINLLIALTVISLTVFMVFKVGKINGKKDYAESPPPSQLVWSIGICSLCFFLFTRGWAISTTGQLYHVLFITTAFWMLLGPVFTTQDLPESYFSASKFIIIGGLLAIGFYIKQTAIIDSFALFSIFLLFVWPRHGTALILRSIFFTLCGFLLITLFCTIYFYEKGTLPQAAYMTFVDPIVYSTGQNTIDTVERDKGVFLDLIYYIFQLNWFISITLILSSTALVYDFGKRRCPTTLAKLGFASAIWLFIDITGLLMIGRFYPHYLIQLIIPLALFSSYCLTIPGVRFRLFATSIACFSLVIVPSVKLINSPPWQPYVKFLDTKNLERTKSYIISHSRPGDGLFLYQTWALCLYFLTNRYPPIKNFMDHQLLPENKDAPELLAAALKGLHERPPKIVVWGNIDRHIPAIDNFILSNYRVTVTYGVYRIYRRLPR